jgi:hypothetical protein
MLGNDGAVVDDAEELLLILLRVLLNESCDMPVVAEELEDVEPCFRRAAGAEGKPGEMLSLSVTILTPVAVLILAGMKRVDIPGEGWRIVRIG